MIFCWFGFFLRILVCDICNGTKKFILTLSKKALKHSLEKVIHSLGKVFTCDSTWMGLIFGFQLDESPQSWRHLLKGSGLFTCRGD